MNSLKQIGFFFNKYLAQILVIALGILVIVIGTTPDENTGARQNSLFLLGGVAMLMAGIISTLYVGEVINKMLHNVMMFVVLPVGVIAYSWFDYRSIKDEVDLRNRIVQTEREVKQRLKDIRDLEVEFKNEYGRYTNNFDSLKWFVREGKTKIILRVGDVPEKIDIDMAKFLGYKEIPTTVISEVEAWKLAQAGYIKGFKRDTTYHSVMDKIFNNDKALGSRNSDYKFNVDSLEIAPYSGGMKFILETSVIKKNNIDVPVFQITEPNPFKKDAPLQVGSLTEVTTNGNWGE